MQKDIKVAIAGVGNCASSLVQGVEYYRDRQGDEIEGVMRHSIGGYNCSDVEFVAAFDIDRRKVGHPLEEGDIRKAELHPNIPERLTRLECHRPSRSCA